MQLRTFKGPDLASALARARRELGPQALVLATSEVPGRLGLSSVEITVCVDGPVESDTERELQRVALEVERLQARLGPEGHLPRPSAGRRPGSTRVEPAEPALHPVLGRAVDALVRSGLSADLAERFTRIAARDLAPDCDARQVAGATERGIAGLLRCDAGPLAARVLLVVGPPGAGKTTTAAKLAARRVGDGSGRVVFAEADTERVGALEQAGLFSRQVGAGLAAVDRPDDVAALASRTGDGDALIVDTAGVGLADGQRLERLAGMRAGVPGAEVLLLLPCGLHADEAREVIARFAPLDPTCAVFSRMDDGRRPGDLVTALAASELPLACMTHGHRVPDDLVDASPRGLAAMLLRPGVTPGRSPEISR